MTEKKEKEFIGKDVRESLSFFLDEENTESCPSEEMLAALADGTLLPKERESLDSHVRECASCAYLLLSLESRTGRGKKGTERIKDRIRKAVPRSWYGLKLIPAAAALLVIFLAASVFFFDTVPFKSQDNVIRSGSSAEVELIQPVGETEPPIVFKWKPVAEAKSYTVDLFDERLTPIWESPQSSKTSTPLPPEITNRLESGKTYFWSVSVLKKSGFREESHTQDFRLK